MQQDGEVADLLRNLVRGDGDRRADAERHRRHHRGGDDGAVDEVVERVADEHRQDAAVVHFAVVGVAVPPEHQLLEDEEEQDAERAACRRRCGAGSCSSVLGRIVEHRHAEQRADGVADQPGTSRARAESLMRRTPEATSRPPRPPSRLSPRAIRSGDTQAMIAYERRLRARSWASWRRLGRDVSASARARCSAAVPAPRPGWRASWPSFSPVAGVAQVVLLAQLVGDARRWRRSGRRSRGRSRCGRRCRR